MIGDRLDIEMIPHSKLTSAVKISEAWILLFFQWNFHEDLIIHIPMELGVNHKSWPW